jgi:hypothetical protein
LPPSSIFWEALSPRLLVAAVGSFLDSDAVFLDTFLERQILVMGDLEMNVFVAHLIGDFILQNEWMAANKKRSSVACLVHVLVYLLPFLLSNLEWWQIVMIGVQHFVQDRTGFVLWWMRVCKRVPPDNWAQIPLFVDQAFHLLWIEIVVLLGGM